MQKEAMLYHQLDNKRVHCYLCAHQCKIADTKFGICGVRQNVDGKLYSQVYGEIIAAHVDPIEKKPLYHFLPGSTSYSIATIGCNFRCGFCQNWQISQVNKRDTTSSEPGYVPPEKIVKEAKANSCRSISYTYTEPTIFFEFAYDTAVLAKKEGLYNVFVTNGFMSKEAVETLKGYLDAANVDLKFFNEESYKKNCSARLQPVLESIKLMRKLNIWVEVTTLVVPGLNDSDQELKNIAEFIASVGKEIPWHISRFHPDYELTSTPPTPMTTLKKAYDIGKNAGLYYVYMGNVTEGNDTYCNNCGKLLIKRNYFIIEKNEIKNGKCSKCNAKVNGLFE